jgi:hypothetical protein
MIKAIARWTFSLFKQLVIPLAQIGLAEMKSSAIQPLKQGITLAQKSQEIVDPADQVNRAYFHIEALRSDIREEIRKRIEQRDRYAMQMIVALGAIIAIAFSRTEMNRVLIVAPLVTIYFTVLILYSYHLHRLLARYLREEIEPRLADICGTPLEVEWEVYYRKHAVPGIRQSFFLWVTWIVCTLVPFYLMVSEWISSTPVFRVALIILSATYLIAAIATTRVATRK